MVGDRVAVPRPEPTALVLARAGDKHGPFQPTPSNGSGQQRPRTAHGARSVDGWPQPSHAGRRAGSCLAARRQVSGPWPLSGPTVRGHAGQQRGRGHRPLAAGAHPDRGRQLRASQRGSPAAPVQRPGAPTQPAATYQRLSGGEAQTARSAHGPHLPGAADASPGFRRTAGHAATLAPGAGRRPGLRGGVALVLARLPDDPERAARRPAEAALGATSV